MSKIKFNKEKLVSVIRDLCVITNVSVAIMDEDFKIIADYSEKCPQFCKEIQKSCEGFARCECSDTSLMKKCRESRTVKSHICHAGILDAAIPIIKTNKIIGYIMIGRMRVLEFDESKLPWLKTDNCNIEKLYYDITEYSEEQIQSIFRIAKMVVSFILTNDIISIETAEFSAAVDLLIEKNISSTLTVSSLCKELNISKNALYEKFRNSFDSTVNDYITAKRLEKGRTLLLKTDLPISLIAEKCGFGSYTYFSKLFKCKNGVSPCAYRKLQKSEKNNP